MQCRKGHSKCFNISDIYRYRLDSKNNLISCRTGGHIQNCEEFNCSSSYCIPWSYVCNGKWDCPHGDDENCEKERCVRMISCYVN